MQQFPRMFSAEEANGMLGELRPLVDEMLTIRTRVVELQPDLEPVLSKVVENGHNINSPTLLDAFDRLKDILARISALGVLVKDVNTGLLDFPSIRDGRIVFLCWRHDEPQVAYWHDLDSGFAGRQPI